MIGDNAGYFPGNLTEETGEPLERIFEEESLIPCYLSEAKPDVELTEFWQRQLTF